MLLRKCDWKRKLQSTMSGGRARSCDAACQNAIGKERKLKSTTGGGRVRSRDAACQNGKENLNQGPLMYYFLSIWTDWV